MSPVDLDAIIEMIEHDDVARAKLRAVLLSEELLALPEQVAESSRQVAALVQRVDALTEQVAESSRQIATLGQWIDALAGQVAESSRQIATLVEVTSTQVKRLDQGMSDLGDLKGFDIERRVRIDPLRYLSRMLRRGRTVHAVELDEEHSLAGPDFDELVRADAIVSGTTAAGASLWVVVEASWRAHRHDIERAKRRAGILARVHGEPVLPVVVSKHDPGEVVVDVAEEEGVALVVASEAIPRAEGTLVAA